MTGQLNRLAALGLFLGVTAILSVGAGHASAQVQAVDGELLVGFRAGVGQGARDAMVHGNGATFVENIGHNTGVVRVRVASSAMNAVARKLARQPQVKFVEKNEVFETALLPNDPQYGNQWYLPRIQAPQAWDVTQGAPGAVIAILDSGVDPYHPDLAGKLVAGFNTLDNNTNTADQYGHGTKMAGVAAARSNNGEGITGVAGGAPIMPVRVTNRAGRATSASIAKGIVWAADHGARVVNLSLGGVFGNAAIRAAAEYAFNHGTLVIAPSGNCGCVEVKPETPYILAVSATDENDSVAHFSTTGSFVKLSAPGANIVTTAKYGLYLTDSGTSAASAIVAGVAALMFSANPALTPAAATQLLQKYAFDGGTAGYGRVNAFAAVTAAASYPPPVTVQ